MSLGTQWVRTLVHMGEKSSNDEGASGAFFFSRDKSESSSGGEHLLPILLAYSGWPVVFSWSDMFSPSTCREEQLNLLPPVCTVCFLSVRSVILHLSTCIYSMSLGIHHSIYFPLLSLCFVSPPSHYFFRHFNIFFLLYSQLSMFSTPTTPTITPTLKNIEVEAAHDEDPFGVQPLLHNHQGGFVPPSVDIVGALRSTHSSSSIGQENMSSNSNFCPSRHSNDGESSDDSDSLSTSFSQDSQSNDSHATMKEFTSTRGSKNTSSRTRSAGNNSNRSTRKTSNSNRETPEEERKKKIRRERNKQAAARCRKRRLDRTNQLTQETEKLDKQKAILEQEFEQKRKEYEKYKLFLEQHKNSNECRCKNENYMQSSSCVVPTSISTASITTTTAPANKVCRPSSLALPPNSYSSSSLPVDPLVSASTPSSGIPIDALLDCTGLTPLLTTPSAGGFMPGIACPSTSTRLPPNETAQSSNEPTTPSKLVSL